MVPGWAQAQLHLNQILRIFLLLVKLQGWIYDKKRHWPPRACGTPQTHLRKICAGEGVSLAGEQPQLDDHVSLPALGFPVSTLSIWFITYCGVQLIKERERILAVEEEHRGDKAKVE